MNALVQDDVRPNERRQPSRGRVNCNGDITVGCTVELRKNNTDKYELPPTCRGLVIALVGRTLTIEWKVGIAGDMWHVIPKFPKNGVYFVEDEVKS